MWFTRRAFLQQTGATLAAWGASDRWLSAWARHYGPALAAPTRRKLALLIGINQYPNTEPLAGCLTDVALQRELLIHRFGFHPQDILCLTDTQATRSAIVTTFVEHLLAQAQPDDLVVFHFSGLGSTVSDGTTPQPSYVTADDPGTDADRPLVGDLLDTTLEKLLRSLSTSHVLTVLDSSHTASHLPLQGSLRVRTRLNPSHAVLTSSDQLLELGLDRQVRLNRTQRNGLRLSALSLGQPAVEVHRTGFTAGLLTYALTQALWQATPASSLSVSLQYAATQTSALIGPPSAAWPTIATAQATPPWWRDLPTTPAEGTITQIDETGPLVHLWLGGMAPAVLEHYGLNSQLRLVQPDAADRPPTLLQIQARDGLIARAKRLGDAANLDNSPLQVGQFVQEQVRLIARNVGLTIALDSHLDRIERVDAISALSAIPRIAATASGDQPADYLFSRAAAQEPTQVAIVPTNTRSDVPMNPSTPGSYGLFSVGLETIPNTIGEPGEAVKVAVRRLTPKLQTLLAIKLLHLSSNAETSQLALQAILETAAPQPTPLTVQDTRPGALPKLPQPPAPVAIVAGTSVQYRLMNFSDRPLYPLLLSHDGRGLVYWESVGLSVAPRAELLLPLTLEQLIKTSQLYLICSRAPFSQTQSVLPFGGFGGPLAMTNPIEVVQAILQDLHQASAVEPALAAPDTLALDMNAWATLQIQYQLV